MSIEPARHGHPMVKAAVAGTAILVVALFALSAVDAVVGIFWTVVKLTLLVIVVGGVARLLWGRARRGLGQHERSARSHADDLEEDDCDPRPGTRNGPPDRGFVAYGVPPVGRTPGRREWDLNPRCPLDTTVFETVRFGRSRIPPDG